MSLIPEPDPITLVDGSTAVGWSGVETADHGALGLAGGKISSLQAIIQSLSMELQQTKLDLQNKSLESDGLAYNLEIAQYQNAEIGNELIQLKDRFHQLESQLATAVEERDGVFKEMVGMSSRHTEAMTKLQSTRDRLEKAMNEMGKAVRLGLTALEGEGK